MADSEITYRFAQPRDLRSVLGAYWKCFDATQRLRTVAASPRLFRYFYAREMRARRCIVALAERGADVVGFAIVRQEKGPDDPWLLSAIGVVPEGRRGGVARRLFGMVADRPLRLTVEVGGPVGFYKALGLEQRATTTLLYVRKADLPELRALADRGAGQALVSAGPVNWKASFLRATGLTPRVVQEAARRTRFGRTAILEIPGPYTLAQSGGIFTVHEVEMATPPPA